MKSKTECDIHFCQSDIAMLFIFMQDIFERLEALETSGMSEEELTEYHRLMEIKEEATTAYINQELKEMDNH